MKLAVTGKGGVGKTTLCALLAKAFTAAGHRVLAVDADPNATLASCLGIADPERITPLSEMSELIEERTGVKPGTQGGFFKMNPRVDDIPARFSVVQDGIRVLRMGAIKNGGAGCYCPEHAFLKSMISHLFLSEQDVLIMDMEAGVEHFGRGTARGVDWLLMVVEPTRQSMETARRIRQLAGDIGLERLGAIGNKCRGDEERAFLVNELAPIPLLGVLPFDDALRQAEREGRSPEISQPGVQDAITQIIARLTAQHDAVAS